MRYVVAHSNLSYVCLMLLNASGTLKVAIHYQLNYLQAEVVCIHFLSAVMAIGFTARYVTIRKS